MIGRVVVLEIGVVGIVREVKSDSGVIELDGFLMDGEFTVTFEDVFEDSSIIFDLDEAEKIFQECRNIARANGLLTEPAAAVAV